MGSRPLITTLITTLIPALAAIAYLGVTEANAQAALPRPHSEGFNDGGGFFPIKPGAMVLTAEHDFAPVSNPSFRWGVAGGYMFAPGRLFKGTIGVALEHDLLMFDGLRLQHFGAHVMRAVPELRLGLGGKHVWGYGLIGVGPTGAMWFWNRSTRFVDGSSGRNSASGLDLRVGLGMQGLIGRTFFLGAQVDFDASLFQEDHVGDWRNNDDSSFSTYQVGFEFLLGWHF